MCGVVTQYLVRRLCEVAYSASKTTTFHRTQLVSIEVSNALLVSSAGDPNMITTDFHCASSMSWDAWDRGR